MILKKLTFIIVCTTFLCTKTAFSQVLWSDDFNSYPQGILNSDTTGQTSGLGNWYVQSNYFSFKVQPETGRGNVLAIGWPTFSPNGSIHINATQKDIDVLWNSRVKTNNVLKLEYDMYVHNYPSTSSGYFRVDNYLRNTQLPAHSEIHCFVDAKGHSLFFRDLADPNKKYLNYTPSWIKVEMYIDFNTSTTYCYIPNLYQSKYTYKKTGIPNFLGIGAYIMGALVHNNALIKYDNFKLSAIPSLPTYLSVNKFIAEKFNVFPNPVSKYVNISNDENIGVKAITIVDLNGRVLKTEKYNNEANVSFNVENVPSGHYILNIDTDKGLVSKKIIKN